MSSPELACADSATVRFGNFTAVNSVTLSVHSGEVVGLLGANGAGKTTLLLALLGLLQASSGRGLLFDALPSAKARKRVGYVPQTLGLYGDMTVEENWMFTSRAFGMRHLPVSPSIRDLADQLVGALPLGAQRRVAFAVAFSHQPELLVLDEPTSGVAPLSAAKLWEDIRASAEGGTGVLVTTHNDWRRAFQLLDGHGLIVQVQGDVLRVPAPVQLVESLLAPEGLRASTAVVPANLEEAFADIVSGETAP